MGTKPNDAFASLMSSVPGVDTSGFVKKSLNDLKTKRNDLKTYQFQSMQARGEAVPRSGTSSSPSIPPRASSAVHRRGGVDIDGLNAVRPVLGNILGKEGGVKSAGGCTGTSAAAPGVIQIGSGDLDSLGVIKPAPGRSGLHEESTSVDPFEAFPGTEVVADVQEPTSGIDDLLGSGLGTAGTFNQESRTEFVDIDPSPYSDTKDADTDLEYQATQKSSRFPDDIHVDESVFFSEVFSEESSHKLTEDTLIGNDVCDESSPADDFGLEALDASGDPKDYESDMDSDDIYSAVVSEDRSRRRQKFSGLSPHLSSAGKSVLASISRLKRSSEDAGEDSSGQNRFMKYSSSLHKKAVEYSKKGFGAVKQGIGAATDWVDKQIDEKKRSASGKRSPESELDTEVMEMAAELKNLSPSDRSLVLEHIDPIMQKKVKELLASQEFIRPGVSAPGTASSSVKEEGHSESPTVGTGSDQELTGSKSMQRPISIPDFGTMRNSEQMVHSGGKSAPSLRNPHGDDDLDILGLADDNEMDDPAFVPSAPAKNASATMDPDELDDFFGGGSYPTTQAQNANDPLQAGPMEDFFGETVVGFNEDLIDVGVRTNPINEEHSHLYKEHYDASSNEPHIRRVLREQRTREKHMKMQDALQDKLLREQEQAEFQENQQDLKRAIGPKIREWKDANQGNLRGLLATLHSVLWEDSGWVKLSVGDLLDNGQVKKAYRKANLIVHPDKVRQKNGTENQTAIADMVFDVLKEAWSQFNG